jgi:N-acetylmuramoyl-L-alanine amidase
LPLIPVPVIAALLLAAAATGAAPLTVELSPRERVEWRRGDLPVVLVLPRSGEGWTQLTARVTGAGGRASALRDANPRITRLLRDVRVRVPWSLLAGELRVAAIRALFPADRRVAEGWTHVILAPWSGEPETWWEMAELFTGDGGRYNELRAANPGAPLFPGRGDAVLVPASRLFAELRDLRPEGAAERRPASAAAPAAPAAGVAASPSHPVAPAVAAAPPATVAARPPAGTDVEAGALEYRDGAAVYRLRAGEALYSAVVVRFTGQLHAPDVSATAADLAKASGIADVTSIPVGYPVRIPLELLLPEYLPAGHPRRRDWEKSREELAAIRRAIRSANLDGVHVILDAGHGGEDTGAISKGVWEATYVYDVMERVKRVLERETRATVWATVRDLAVVGSPPELDLLPKSRNHRLLVQPPYDLSDSVTGVQLRWVLSNAILARLQKQKVNPESVAFVSIHADSLHPTVRGMMVYTPARALRKNRGPSPAGIWDCREAREAGTPTFPAAFRSRAEALSEQLAGSVIASARRYGIPIHKFKPVRDSVIRGGSAWVPAVLRYNRVPTSVLVELGNLNNEDDREQLTTWRFREKLAHAIAAGLAEGFSR